MSKPKKIRKAQPAPITNNELEKFLNHPVILKKAEDAKRVIG